MVTQLSWQGINNIQLYTNKQYTMEFVNTLEEPKEDLQSTREQYHVQEKITMKEQMANYVWLEGRERAKKALNVYGHIDFLRPYFNVEPKEVTTRLVDSLLPRFGNSSKSLLIGELYGPLMVVLSLIALLLYGMKTSGHIVKEGTLMGTACGVSFGYWFGASFVLYCLTYVCNSQISYIQMLSLTGYALFGHCVVIFVNTVFHSDTSHQLFFLTWIIFGGLSSLKMAIILMGRTSGRSQRFILLTSVIICHMLFLLYLHFAYHEMVEVFENIR